MKDNSIPKYDRRPSQTTEEEHFQIQFESNKAKDIIKKLQTDYLYK